MSEDGFNPSIWISYTTAWRGKPTGAQHANAEGSGKNEGAGIWKQKETTPRRVMETVTSDGYAFCARLTGPRRSRATFAAMYLAGVDFDEGTSIEDVLDRYPLARNHASFAYQTSSHTPERPRTRLVFCLEVPITDAADAGELLAALAYNFGDEKPDKSVFQAERLWYGAPGKHSAWIGGRLGPGEAAELVAAWRASDACKPWREDGNPDSEQVARNLKKALKVLDFARYGHSEPERYEDGYRIKLAQCPFNPEEEPHGEDKSSVVIVRGDGRIAAMCQHNRCQERINESGGSGWNLLKHLVGYDKAAHVNGNGTRPRGDIEPPHDDANEADGASESARYMKTLARLGYTFAENEMDNSIEVSGQLLSDGLAAQIRCQMRDAGHKRVPAFEDAYRADAYRNLFHPVRRWLEAQTWDGRDRFAELAQYVATEQAAIDGENPVTVWVRHWLVNAVGKCYTQRQNVVLVLDGGQGVGKSTLVRWLCPLPEWHKEGFLDPHDRELSRALATKLVWEVNELGATMRKADQDALKAILTQESVTFRTPYARNAITRRTLVSFMGTINNVAGFLSDVSGDRRFVVLPIARIDYAYSQALPVAQLWAQAAHYWRAGLYMERTAAMRAAQRTGNEEYRVGDPFAAQIAAICELTGDTGDTVSSLDLLHRLTTAGLRESSPKATEMAIGAACKALGLERKRPQLNGVRQVVYTGARFKV